MDDKKFEQEYKTLKQQAAPDLWSRIEQNLAEHPEREESAAQIAEAAGSKQKKKKFRRIPAWRSAYGMAAAAAVVLVVVVANRQTGSLATADEMMLAETMAAAPEMAEGSADSDGYVDSNGYAGSKSYAGSASGSSILTYEDLQLAAYQPMAVPEQAITVPEDSRYFAEAILGDTGLLCGGTVTDVSLEQDASGRAVKVVYEISVDQVYYAEDYTTGMDRITVKSPIVETEGDEAYVLYQLQKDGTYLLPLEQKDGSWELLYPFAPQIQVTGDGAYLFHSGYSSLAGSDASVVIGSQEGAGDYYYDRMLLRNDDNFLTDLVSLVEREAQGRK